MNFLVVFAALCVVGVRSDCKGTPNQHPIIDQAPKALRSVPNASLFQVGDEDGKSMRVLHLYGSPYDMGVAQGAIFRDEIPKMVAGFFEYLDSEIEPYIKWLPQDVQQIILTKGPRAALQFEVDLTRPYISQYFLDEIRGIADGCNCNISYDEFLQIHLFPELIKASCSMYGAWSKAIADVQGGTLMQLRALDWGIDNPLLAHQIVAVYHPLPGQGYPFSSLTFTGFIGSVTSYGTYVGMSEKVWLSYNETASRAGVPFHFLIRDAAQFDRTLDDTINRIVNNKRTCSVHLGVGSRLDNQFRVIEYSHEEVFVYDDKNFPAYPPAHPLFDDLVFINKHVQPSQDTCLTSMIQQNYGHFDAATTISFLGQTQSGDMHAAFYDYGANIMHVSIAGPEVAANGTVVAGTLTEAYNRPWFKIDMTEAFGRKQ